MRKEEAYHWYTNLLEISILAKGFSLPLDQFHNTEVVNFSVQISHQISFKEEFYFILKTIEVDILDEGNFKLGNFKVIFSFELKEPSKFIISTTTEEHEIDTEYDRWLNNIVIATTRGLMYAEFRGTFLSSVILPLTEPPMP